MSIKKIKTVIKRIILLSPFYLFSFVAVAKGMVINHDSVSEFDLLINNSSAVSAAANLRYYFRHASVGGNIGDDSGGVGSLSSSCILDCDIAGCCSGLDALEKSFTGFNRTRFHFQSFYDGVMPDWQGKINNFRNYLSNQTTRDNYEFFAMKFCYVDLRSTPSVDTIWTAYQNMMNDLTSQYPQETFIWWTMPYQLDYLEDNIIRASRNQFNNNVRSFAIQNNKLLFDLGSIESHLSDGSPCVDSSNSEVLCSSYYNNDGSGGHLNVAGRVRVAKAFWVLMARLAGWQPGGSSPSPSLSPSPSPSVSPSPSPSASLSPSPSSSPESVNGDIDANGTVNAIDVHLLLDSWQTVSQQTDLNSDGKVNSLDMAVVLANFGN